MSHDKPELRIDWCSYEAAKYAVTHWHYSKRMPKSKLAKIGVWEDGRFIGVAIFGVGATADLVKRFGIDKTQGCELVRVALAAHRTPVTKIIALAMRILKREMPGLRLVVSFADPEHGHNGGIYQGGNWLYCGMSQASEEYVVNGKRWHGRAFRASKPARLTTREAALQMDPDYQVVMGSSKHRYLYPLDKAMAAQIEPLRQPYPKRADVVQAVEQQGPPADGGANPTRPLEVTT